MTLRCISFVAVSSTQQAEEISLEEQRAINARNAQDLGGYVAHTLTVPGHTREYDTLFEIAEDVPAYRQMWDLIRNRQADVLLAYTADRLARTESLLLDLARKCWRHDVALFIDNLRPQSLDPAKQARDLTQKMLLAIAGVQSSDEVVKLRERHRFGMRSRAQDKGRMSGKIPYGYMPQVRGTDVYPVPDPETVDIVRWLLLDLFAGEHLGLASMAARLNAAGCISPGVRRRQLYPSDKTRGTQTWTRTTVRNIVDRAEVYGGFVVYNRHSRRNTGRSAIVAPGQHDAIISEDELARVLSERDQRQTGPQRVYAFSGVTRCYTCDRPMKMNFAPGPNREYRYYRYLRCTQCGRHLKEDELAGLMRAWLAHAGTVTDAVDRAGRRRRQEIERLESDIAYLRDQIADIDRSIGNLLDLAEAGAEVGELARRIKDRKQQRVSFENDCHQLRQQIRRLQVESQTDVERVRSQGLGLLDNVQDEPGQVRAWLVNVGITIWAQDDGVAIEIS